MLPDYECLASVSPAGLLFSVRAALLRRVALVHSCSFTTGTKRRTKGSQHMQSVGPAAPSGRMQAHTECSNFVFRVACSQTHAQHQLSTSSLEYLLEHVRIYICDEQRATVALW